MSCATGGVARLPSIGRGEPQVQPSGMEPVRPVAVDEFAEQNLLHGGSLPALVVRQQTQPPRRIFLQ